MLLPWLQQTGSAGSGLSVVSSPSAAAGALCAASKPGAALCAPASADDELRLLRPLPALVACGGQGKQRHAGVRARRCAGARASLASMVIGLDYAAGSAPSSSGCAAYRVCSQVHDLDARLALLPRAPAPIRLMSMGLECSELRQLLVAGRTCWPIARSSCMQQLLQLHRVARCVAQPGCGLVPAAQLPP
jgi:hypothetical protein